MHQEFTDQLVEAGVAVGALWKALLSVGDGLARGERYKKGLLGVLGDLLGPRRRLRRSRPQNQRARPEACLSAPDAERARGQSRGGGLALQVYLSLSKSETRPGRAKVIDLY